MIRDEFKSDDSNQAWQIHWLCALSLNPNVPSESKVQALMKSISPDGNAPANFRTVPVGIGSLGNLTIGSKWLNGEQQHDDSHLDSFKGLVDFSIKTEAVNAYSRISPAGVSPTRYLINKFKHEIPTEAADTPCYVYPLPNKGGRIIIPGSEIVRAYFLRSSASSLALMSGPIDRAIERIINVRATKESEANGHARVVLQPTMSVSDAPLAIMLWHSSVAKIAAATVMGTAMSAAPNRKRAFLQAPMPLKGLQQIEARGKSWGNGSEKTFLVLQLCAIPFPDVGSAEITFSVTQAELDPNDFDAPEISVPIQPTRNSDRPEPYLGHQREPNKSLDATILRSEVPKWTLMPLLKKVTEVRKFASARFYPEEEESTEEEGEHSSGEGIRSGNVRPYRLKDKSIKFESVAAEQIPHIAADFQSMIGAADWIKADTPGISLEFVAVTSEKDQFDGLPLSTLRRDINSKNRNWPIVNNRARRLMVMKVRINNHNAYVLEIERKKDTESFTTCVVISAHGSDVTDFSGLLQTIVEKTGVWPKEYPGLLIEKLPHIHRSAKDFGMHIIDAIKGLINSKNQNPKLLASNMSR